MYWMKSFADELTKIAVAGTVAREAAAPGMRFVKPVGAMALGALGLHEAQKLKKKYDLGSQVYEQHYGR